MLTGKHSESFRRRSKIDYFALSFDVDIESHKDAQFLFAYVNGADSYTKQQLIVFAF